MNSKKELLDEIKYKLKNIKIYQNIKFPDFSLSAKKQRTNPELRLQLFDNIDVRGKTVYDLGCSNGFFCFELAKRGAKVIGIDKNKDTIKLNKLISEYYDLDIQFFEDDLLDETFYTERMEKSDIVIFLSVIHHIYNKTQKNPSQFCNKILQTISKKTGYLFFETGQSGEPFHWSIKLGEMGLDPKNWILSNWLHNTSFLEKEVLDAFIFKGKKGRRKKFISNIYRKSIFQPQHPLRNYFIYFLYRLFISDPRETRFIFICSK